MQQRIDRSARVALIDGFARDFGVTAADLLNGLRAEEGLGDQPSISARIRREHGDEVADAALELMRDEVSHLVDQMNVPSSLRGEATKAALRKHESRLILLAVPDDWFMVAIEVGIAMAQNIIGEQAIDSLSNFADTDRVTRWVERVFQKNGCPCKLDDDGRISWTSSLVTHQPLTAPDNWEKIDTDLVALKNSLARAHRSIDFNGVGAQCDSILKRIGRIVSIDAVQQAADSAGTGKDHAARLLEHLVDAYGTGKTFEQVRKKLSPGLFEAAYDQAQRAKHSLDATHADAVLAVVLLDAVSEIARLLAERQP